MVREKKALRRHLMSARVGDGSLSFPGFGEFDPKDLACFIADGGNHFLKYGVSEGSALLVCMGAEPKSGDLVITGSTQAPNVRLFTPGEESGGGNQQCPTVIDDDQIIAVVLGSFNFYR